MMKQTEEGGGKGRRNGRQQRAYRVNSLHKSEKSDKGNGMGYKVEDDEPSVQLIIKLT